MQYLYHGCLHIYLLCRNFCDLIYNMHWTFNITTSSTEGAKCGTGTAYPLQFTSKWWCGPRWWSLQFKQWWTTIPAYQQNEDTITSQLKQLNTCVSYGPIIKLVSVTPPLWIEVPVRRQGIERSCIFMLGYQFWFFYIQFIYCSGIMIFISYLEWYIFALYCSMYHIVRTVPKSNKERTTIDTSNMHILDGSLF